MSEYMVGGLINLKTLKSITEDKINYYKSKKKDCIKVGIKPGYEEEIKYYKRILKLIEKIEERKAYYE